MTNRTLVTVRFPYGSFNTKKIYCFKLNTEDLILSINGAETDSMTIPEVLAQLVNVDVVSYSLQMLAKGASQQQSSMIQRF